MTDITLNCRIVSNDLLCDRSITIDRGQAVSALETAIQNNLGASFNEVPLKIRQIHPSSANERLMQSQTLISVYFTGQPEEATFISPYTLYHRSKNNFLYYAVAIYSHFYVLLAGFRHDVFLHV